MKALILNCTLKPSPETSSTEALAQVAMKLGEAIYKAQQAGGGDEAGHLPGSQPHMQPVAQGHALLEGAEGDVGRLRAIGFGGGGRLGRALIEHMAKVGWKMASGNGMEGCCVPPTALIFSTGSASSSASLTLLSASWCTKLELAPFSSRRRTR